jgi:hypothetical protein
MTTHEDVRRIALSLPQTSEAVDHFGFGVLSKGKLRGFAWAWNERIEPKKPRVPNPEVLAVRVAHSPAASSAGSTWRSPCPETRNGCSWTGRRPEVIHPQKRPGASGRARTPADPPLADLRAGRASSARPPGRQMSLFNPGAPIAARV